MRLFMSADVPKMKRKRFSTPGWSSCAQTFEINKTPASAAKKNRAIRKCFEKVLFTFNSLWPFETVLFRAIALLQFILQFRQRISNHADEIRATGHRPAKSAHHVAFRKIVRHHQHFAVIPKPMRRALNHVVRRLSGARK